MGKRKRGRTKHRVKGKTKRRVKGKTKRRINRSRRMGGSDLVRTSARERDIERAKEYLQEMGFQAGQINNIKRHIEGQGKLFTIPTLRMACLSILSEIPDGCLPEKSSWDEW
jgi:hypothetical protein